MQTTNSKTTTARHCSSILLLAVSTALLFSMPLDAQQNSFASGTRAEAMVRTSVGLTMPVLMNLEQTAQPIATWQGERFTEYVIRYSVATNSRWEVTAGDLPTGITVLTEGGVWVDARSSRVVVTRGEPTNLIEVLVRIRVADGTSALWQSDLTIAASRAGY